jgi:hypothetical protein
MTEKEQHYRQAQARWDHWDTVEHGRVIRKEISILEWLKESNRLASDARCSALLWAQELIGAEAPAPEQSNAEDQQ